MGNLANKQQPDRRNDDHIGEDVVVGTCRREYMYVSEGQLRTLSRSDKKTMDAAFKAGGASESNALLTILDDISPIKRNKSNKRQKARPGRRFHCAKVYPTVQDLRKPDVLQAAAQEHDMDMFLAPCYRNMKSVSTDGEKATHH